MDFSLSEDHQILSDSLRRYLAQNCDIETRNRAAYTAPYHLPELWKGLADLGVIGAFVREDQGGFGGGAEDVSVVFEELGLALCSEPVLGALLGVRLLAALGQTELAGRVIEGDARAAVAVFEPEVTLELSQLSAQAQKDDAHWRLSGVKSAIYGGPGADHILVAARTWDGIGLFRVDAPDLVCAAMIDGGGIADLVMDDLPAECLSTDCADDIAEALDLGRIALCAEAVGAMTRLVDQTIDYLQQRNQFGRPLASFQALQHRVVDMLVDLEQCRSITISAVARFGTPGQAKHVAMAKHLIGRMGSKIAEEAIQLHGGIGMTWEYPGAHYAKRLVMIDHQLGDRHDHILQLALGQASA